MQQTECPHCNETEFMLHIHPNTAFITRLGEPMDPQFFDRINSLYENAGRPEVRQGPHGTPLSLGFSVDFQQDAESQAPGDDDEEAPGFVTHDVRTRLRDRHEAEEASDSDSGSDAEGADRLPLDPDRCIQCQMDSIRNQDENLFSLLYTFANDKYGEIDSALLYRQVATAIQDYVSKQVNQQEFLQFDISRHMVRAHYQKHTRLAKRVILKNERKLNKMCKRVEKHVFEKTKDGERLNAGAAKVYMQLFALKAKCSFDARTDPRSVLRAAKTVAKVVDTEAEETTKGRRIPDQGDTPAPLNHF